MHNHLLVCFRAKRSLSLISSDTKHFYVYGAVTYMYVRVTKL
jgi:hypothetical protein